MSLRTTVENRLVDNIEELERIVRQDPHNPRSRNILGIGYSQTCRYAEARREFEKAVELAPANERYWYNLGTSYAALGLSAFAMRSFQSALRIAPTYERAGEAMAALRSSAPGNRDRSADPIASLFSERTGNPHSDTVQPRKLPSPASPRLSHAAGDREPFGGPNPGIQTRVTSSLLDLAAIQMIWILVIIAINYAAESIPGLPRRWVPVLDLAGPLVGAVSLALMASSEGQTPGKRVLRLRLVGADGDRPAVRTSLIRLAACLLHIPTLGITYYWMLRRPQNRALHDRFSYTDVLGRRLDSSSAFIWIFTLIGVNALLAVYVFYQILA